LAREWCGKLQSNPFILTTQSQSTKGSSKSAFGLMFHGVRFPCLCDFVQARVSQQMQLEEKGFCFSRKHSTQQESEEVCFFLFLR
jgi:hypothetical protein